MRIETVMIEALDGIRLHTDLARVDDPIGAVVLTHPHPLYGGDRFSPVVDSLFGALPEAGLTAARFDFRGVNESEGEHDDGDAERLDVVAAIDLIDFAAPNVPVWLVGYSFGAVVALNVVEPRVTGWIAIAPPLAVVARRCLAAADHRRKLILSPAHDQYSPPAATAEIVHDWPSTELQTVESADHFLGGRIAAVTTTVVECLTAR